MRIYPMRLVAITLVKTLLIIDTDTYIPIYSSLSKMSRYKCKCCKYKRDYRLFATTCVRHDFREVDVQTLCTYLKVPIERPAEWPLLDSKQTYVRPSVLWELDRQGTIEIWSQRPNKLEEILKKVLQRDDLAKKHQELLDKYHPVKKCLQQFQSNDSSPVSSTEVIPIQETTAAVHVNVAEEATSSTTGHKEEQGTQKGVLITEKHTSEGNPAAELDLLLTLDRYHLQAVYTKPPSVVTVRVRDSDRSSDSRRVSSGFFERTVSSVTSRTTSGASTMSYWERSDSGVIVANRVPSIMNTNDPLGSATASPLSSLTREFETASVESIVDGFCTNCRIWINNISPHGSQTSSPPPPTNDNSKINTSHSSSTEDSHSFSSASTNFESSIPTTSSVEKQVKISGKIEVKRKELLKHLESSKQNWLHKSSRFPDFKELQGHPGQYRMRLHRHDSSAATNQSCATLSLDLHPVSRNEVQLSPITIFVSVYATNNKASMEREIIINNARIDVQQTTIRETTEIAQFLELITIDLLKRLEEKYIVTEVSVIYQQKK